jgi:uncharacterized protein YprB with RNaseH-like and TPR domain
VSDWAQLAGAPAPLLPGSLKETLLAAASAAEQALAAGDLPALAALLPPDERWRLCGAFADRAVFLDIEADLLLRHEDWVPSFPVACQEGEARQRRAQAGIAAVGLLDARGPRVLLSGRDLQDAPAAIPASCLLVTYNGGAFDLPALERAFPGWRRPPAHLDLRPLLARLGHRGGLKAIEQQTRVGRPDHLCDLPGQGVVWLWRRAAGGDVQALRLFAEYNLYDVVNLRPLMCLAYNGLAARTGLPFAPLPVPERGDVLYDVSKLLLAL